MFDWWNGLDAVNQWFYVAAAFFSVFFLWQLISAFIGLGGGDASDDVTTHVDVGADHGPADTTAEGDAHATVAAFQVLSIRSILAFFTLFTWAGALYLNVHVPLPWAMFYALFWGLGALVAVSLIMHFMRKMTETGNIQVGTCVGTMGTVYLDVSAGGQGEARVTVSGILTHMKARAVGGKALKAGTPVRVVRTLGPGMIEVEEVEPTKSEGN